MRRSILFMGATVRAGALASSAQAQTIVSMGKGYAHDCFTYAKAGIDPYDGVAVCDQAIAHEALTIKDRAATYDNRGVMLDLLGRTEKAAADFRQSMALDATLGDPYVNLGSMMIKEKRYDE